MKELQLYSIRRIDIRQSELNCPDLKLLLTIAHNYFGSTVKNNITPLIDISKFDDEIHILLGHPTLTISEARKINDDIINYLVTETDNVNFIKYCIHCTADICYVPEFRKIKNYSRLLFERDFINSNNAENVRISIISPDDTTPVNANNSWKDYRQIAVDDITFEIEEAILFNKDHALTLFEMVLDTETLQIKDDIKDIIIHCDAGISRSAAVRLFLSQLNNKQKATNVDRSSDAFFNRHIFITLRKTYDDLCVEKNLPLYHSQLKKTSQAV